MDIETEKGCNIEKEGGTKRDWERKREAKRGEKEQKMYSTKRARERETNNNLFFT